MGLHLLMGIVMVFLHPCEDEVILIYLGKVTFLSKIKGIGNHLLKLEMSVQGVLILVLLLMIYTFPRVQKCLSFSLSFGCSYSCLWPNPTKNMFGSSLTKVYINLQVTEVCSESLHCQKTIFYIALDPKVL